jgi:hypothetical protein
MVLKLLSMLLLITISSAQAEPGDVDMATTAEGHYLRFLEAQNKLWQAERNSKSISIRGEFNDYEDARVNFEASRQNLENHLYTIQKTSKRSAQLVKRLQAARKNWFAKNDDAADPTYLSYLQQRFTQAQAARLSPLEWQAIRDIYGQQTEEALLQTNFVTKHWRNDETTNHANKNMRIVWIQDPYVSLAPDLREKNFPEFATICQKSLDLKDFSTTNNAGVTVDKIFISDYESLESQSAELLRQLQVKYFSEDYAPQILIVSSGQASALVYELLDRYPELRKEQKIAGWVNWNGLLFGMPLRESQYQQTAQRIKAQNGRALATVATPWEITPAQKMYVELTQGQLVRQQKILPLGKGFPIWSIVPARAEDRASPELREAIVADGETWFWNQKTESSSTVITGLIQKLNSAEFAAN